MLSKQENREILGKKIEELRKAKEMTQAELAKKAGFSGRGAALPLPYLKTIVGHSVNMNSYHYYHESDKQTEEAASILNNINISGFISGQ